ncbi:hypothetical protein PG994_002981 [Apiospora phragmitis]|uniref:Uncharacterized protein n=1 Tax=Apiospora phragmitis TaxID=2905665 RepID=A0ABR1WAI1_9PEZI
MEPHRVLGSREIAEWNRDLFQGFDEHGTKDHLVSEPLQYRLIPPVAPPIRPGAPTIITTLTWEEDIVDDRSRSLEEYFPRFQKLADTGKMAIFYTNERLRARGSVWDVPNNQHQRANFANTQPQLFKQFQDQGPRPRYNVDRLSAAYNSKAYCIFDGVQRAPFGADGPFMFYDAGWILVNYGEMPGFDEISGAAFLDDAKVARSAAFAGDTGVVVGEYEIDQGSSKDPTGPPVDVDHRCFQDPECSWEALHFLGGSVVGSALGMLNYAARYMTDGRGHGRQRLLRRARGARHVVPGLPVSRHHLLGARRRGAGLPPALAHPRLPLGPVGARRPGELVDPVQTLFCRFYQPRRPNLPAVAGKRRLAAREQLLTPPETSN